MHWWFRGEVIQPVREGFLEEVTLIARKGDSFLNLNSGIQAWNGNYRPSVEPG